jgi:hypothetical protein
MTARTARTGQQAGGADDLDPVVERTFERHTASGVSEVRLVLGRPAPDPADGGDWRCRVVITGLPDPVDRHAYGIDALQALALAIEMAAADLRYARLPAGERVTFLGGPDLGLPRLPAPDAA